tara:strand:+ start:625 stop:1323 length:699 start_codon:yes stop_codon:yes gene_type:complete
MMLQSINKKKIYFYIFLFLFLSTIFNLNLLKSFKEIISVNNINIKGLNKSEEMLVKEELKVLLKNNIFFLQKDLILESLDKFNFLENIIVNKTFPSKINIYLEKTKFVALTLIDGEKYYIGKNGKTTNTKQIINKKNLPIVFGKFKINEFLQLQEILKKQKINLDEIEKYFYFRNNRWDLQKKDGLIIMLPSNNLERSLKIYKKFMSNKNSNLIKIIDLRIANQIILTNEKK